MARMPRFGALFLLVVTMSAAGCRSPYHSDQGALFGGLLGAGTGAIVGNALGAPGAGAAIGAGVGALSGAAIGNGMDEVEANNRAMIAQQLGRQVSASAVTVNDVVTMTRAGVNEELIVNHVRAHGVAAPLQANDLIYLQQQGVSPRVVATMQTPPLQPAQPLMMPPPGPVPVIVEPYPYSPYWGPCYYPRHHYYHRPGMSWGVTVRN